MKTIKYKNRFSAIIASCIMLFALSFAVKANAQGSQNLSQLLETLNAEYSSINNLIPNRYDFSDGETGYYIDDGGGDMYDGGNMIGTNLGQPVYYSNNTINSSNYFGSNGQYFTRKYPGLFVMAANLDNIDEFYIYGNLGADGSGNLDGTVLTSGMFQGFVKRVYNAGDPSVNHLIITAYDPNVSHWFPNSTDMDDHHINGLSNINRIYYLLYAGSNGFYINDDATQQIMDAFVALLVTDTIPPNPVSGLMVSNILNSSALLTFTAPYDDTLTEPVTAYDVRLSTSPINTQNYFDAPVYAQSVVPGAPGTTDSLTVTGLTGETQYWVGISAIDEGGNYSTPVFTSFTTMPDPVIEVSISELELEVPVGEILTSSFQIANAEADAGPLAFSINSGSQNLQETMAYIVKDGYIISKVDFNNQEIEEYYFDVNISELIYHKATGNLWLTSYDFNRLMVFSTETNSIIMTQTISSPRYIFTTNDQDKIGVVYYSYPAKIDIYDPATLQIINTFNLSGNSEAFDAKFSPDGSKLYIASYSDLVEYDSESGQVLNTFNPEYYEYYQFTISNDGNYAYCNSYSSSIRKFNLSTGVMSTGNSNNWESTKMALSPDGELLYIGYYSGNQIQVMNTQTMSVVSTLNKNSSDRTNDIRVSNDGNLLYCLNRYSPNLIVFDLQSSSIVQSYTTNGNTTRFAFGGIPQSLLEFNPATGIIAGGESQEIEIILDAIAMLPGIYQSEISIESNDPSNPLITIPVTLYAKDVTGPDFNLVFFQNHYLTSNLKLLVFAREELPETPGLKDGSDDLDVIMLDSIHYMYYSDYKLTTTENITFTVTGIDSVGNASTFERVLSSTKALKNQGITARYPNDDAVISFSSEAFNNDLFVTIWKEEIDELTVFHLGPGALHLYEPAKLSLSYANDYGKLSDLNCMAIFIKDESQNDWRPIPSTINNEAKTVNAFIDQLGTFKIGYDENIYSPIEQDQSPTAQSVTVAPNPFKNETLLKFYVPADGFIKVELTDLMGNQIVVPANQYYVKGSHDLVISGNNLKSGVYFLKVNIANVEHTLKLIRIDQ